MADREPLMESIDEYSEHNRNRSRNNFSTEQNLRLVREFLYLLKLSTQSGMSVRQLTPGISDTKNNILNYEQTKNLGNFRNK